MLKTKKYNGSNILVEYDSSNLKSANYDTNTKKLTITFNNGLSYEYDDVPHDTFAGMNLSESTGKYFNQNIAKKYNYRKVINS